MFKKPKKNLKYEKSASLEFVSRFYDDSEGFWILASFLSFFVLNCLEKKSMDFLAGVSF